MIIHNSYFLTSNIRILICRTNYSTFKITIEIERHLQRPRKYLVIFHRKPNIRQKQFFRMHQKSMRFPLKNKKKNSAISVNLVIQLTKWHQFIPDVRLRSRDVWTSILGQDWSQFDHNAYKLLCSKPGPKWTDTPISEWRGLAIRSFGRHVYFHLILDVFHRPRSRQRGRVNMHQGIVVLRVYSIYVVESVILVLFFFFFFFLLANMANMFANK